MDTTFDPFASELDLPDMPAEPDTATAVTPAMAATFDTSDEDDWLDGDAATLDVPQPVPTGEVRVLAFAPPEAPEPVFSLPTGFEATDMALAPEADEQPEGPVIGRMADDDDVAQMLAPFFHKGFLARREARGLMDPAKREEAERRLNGVGLTLSWSPYSRYYGLALADGPGNRVERITNLSELDRNALALLVILWARLVLPQRLAEEGREGGVNEPSVSFDALNAEYGKKLGGRRFEMYVSQLKRLGFLEYTRKDEIKAGPFLDLLGDSNKLASYLRQSTLARVLADVPGVAPEVVSEDAATSLAAIEPEPAFQTPPSDLANAPVATV